MTKRKLVTIRKIDRITPINDAAFIELVQLGGWQCVTKKGEFCPGDLCVYFEVDSFLPIEERYEFLRKSSYKKMLADTGATIEGFRLRTSRFRGALSQGLALPLSVFEQHPQCTIETLGLRDQTGKLFREGDDVTALLGVQKYDPPLPTSLSGTARGLFPPFIHKTDEERIQNLPEYFDRFVALEFECTEKVDGTSMTVYHTAEEDGVCSRNLDLVEDDHNTLWRVAKQLQLHPLLKETGRNLALQGELAGEKIQKNPLAIQGQQLFLFNVFDIDQKTYLNPEERMELFQFLHERVPIRHVPVVAPRIKVFEKLPEMEQLLEFATGPSEINPAVTREGVVFKSLSKVGVETISFKAISNKYLLKHGG